MTVKYNKNKSIFLNSIEINVATGILEAQDLLSFFVKIQDWCVV